METKYWHIALFVAVIIAIAALLHPTHFRMGWMYLRSGELTKAIDVLKQVYEKDPKDYHAMRWLAEGLENAGQVDQAGVYYEKLARVRPDDENFRELVRFFTWTLQPQKAKAAYEQWMDYRLAMGMPFDDEDGKQLLNDLYAYDLTYQDYDNAIKVLHLLMEVEPQEREALQGDLIQLYAMTGDLEMTMRLLTQELDEHPENVHALEMMMQLAPFCGKSKLARGYLVRDVDAHPEDAKSWNRLIDFEMRQGQLREADGWYVKWLALRPDDWALKKQYVGWLLATEQQKLAIAYLEALLPNRLADPFYREMLTKLYEWNGEKTKLVPIYQARFDRNPRDQKNAMDLIWLLEDLKRYDQEERVLKRLVAISPRDDRYVKMLFDFYEARGNSNAAISLLEKRTKGKADPALLKRLGELYLWSATAPSGGEVADVQADDSVEAPRVLEEGVFETP
jgi:tetratricopeptide (TPR) repeat protein